jgi:hypothetical protein
MSSRSASRMTSARVVPSTSAATRAASHSSSSTRTIRCRFSARGLLGTGVPILSTAWPESVRLILVAIHETVEAARNLALAEAVTARCITLEDRALAPSVRRVEFRHLCRPAVGQRCPSCDSRHNTPHRSPCTRRTSIRRLSTACRPPQPPRSSTRAPLPRGTRRAGTCTLLPWSSESVVLSVSFAATGAVADGAESARAAGAAASVLDGDLEALGHPAGTASADEPSAIAARVIPGSPDEVAIAALGDCLDCGDCCVHVENITRCTYTRQALSPHSWEVA